jgi:hypothetical protein
MRSPRETRGIGRWGFRSLVLERVLGIDLRSSVIEEVREEIEGVRDESVLACECSSEGFQLGGVLGLELGLSFADSIIVARYKCRFWHAH